MQGTWPAPLSQESLEAGKEGEARKKWQVSKLQISSSDACYPAATSQGTWTYCPKDALFSFLSSFLTPMDFLQGEVLG